MNTDIKNKLNELIGKNVVINSLYGGVSIEYDPNKNCRYKVLRFEGDNCVVLGVDNDTMFVSIDHIPSILIRK